MADCKDCRFVLRPMNESWIERIQRARVINVLTAVNELPDLIHSRPNELVDIIDDIAKEAARCLSQLDYEVLHRCENCANHTWGAGPAADGYIYCEADKKTHCKESTCKDWIPEKRLK